MENQQLAQWLEVQLSEVIGTINKYADKPNMIDNSYWLGQRDALESVLKKVQASTPIKPL